MAYPNTRITVATNLWLRQMHFEKAGDANEGHLHDHDHMTLLAHGKVRINVEGNVSEFSAPHMIFIQKGKRHFIEALEDGTIAYCVHALRNKESAESEILDLDQIPVGINLRNLAKAL
jgi:quercetin dioxygenase-like cupin family protein